MFSLRTWQMHLRLCGGMKRVALLVNVKTKGVRMRTQTISRCRGQLIYESLETIVDKSFS